MAFLEPDKIRTEHGLTIKEKIIPWGAKWPKNSGKFTKGERYKADRKLSNGTGKVEWVTIHNTDDIREAKGTNDAEQYARATWPNCNMGDVRVHYYIDETDCWQQLREDEVGWHAADGVGPGNETSLAIEIIMDGSGSPADKAAEDRGALLAAILLDRHGLGIDRLTTHYRWYKKKYCPQYILPHWDDFRAQVAANLAKIQAPEQTEEPTCSTLYRVQVGAYSNSSNAYAKLMQVKAAGFTDAYRTYDADDKMYRIQVGAYAVRANAEAKLAEVLAADFDAFIAVEIMDGAPAIRKGDRVKIRKGAKTYTGGGLASFVYGWELKVSEVVRDRVVVTRYGITIAAVNIADLVLL